MRRFGIGLGIGFITFLVGIMPFYFSFEGLFGTHGSFVDCAVDLSHRVGYGITSDREVLRDYVDESREIYAVVLEDEMYGRPYIVISDETTPGDWFTGVDRGKLLSGVEKETFDSYNRGNSFSSDLRNKLNDDSRIHFLSINEDAKIFKQQRNGWADFRKRFPSANGLLTFSSVGFNLTHTQALVSVERQCGGLCGDGTFVVMKKINGHWMIARKIIAWSSSGSSVAR